MDDQEIDIVKTDFTQDEQDSLKDWELNNRPGIHGVTEDRTFEWFRLYMSGKSYTEIAQATKSKKDLILFSSRSQKWFVRKTEYYADISENMLDKYKEAKIESLNTMTTMVSAMNKYFGNKFTKYIKTNDESIMEELDSKMLAQYQKINDSMDKIVAAITGKSDEDKPLLNINMTGNAKIKQIDSKTIEIEADDDVKEEQVRDILASLSKVKKIREEN